MITKGGVGSGIRGHRTIRSVVNGIPTVQRFKVLETLKQERARRKQEKNKPIEKPKDTLDKLKAERDKLQTELDKRNAVKPVEKPSKPDKTIEGKPPVIEQSDRKQFLEGIAAAPGGKFKIDSVASKKFMEDGDIEKFVSKMESIGGRDGFVAGLRAEAAYAEKFGGIDIAKSKSLTDIHKKSAELAKKFSDDEIGSIQEYTTDAYADVNSALRKGEKLDKNGQQMVSAISKIVDGVGKWDSPATIYHGVSSSSVKSRKVFLDKVHDAIKNKSIWEEKGILSTSASPAMSQDWVANSAGGGIIMRIKANRGAVISSFTGLSAQQEILQKPGSTYRPIKVSEEKGLRGGKITVVDFEQI